MSRYRGDRVSASGNLSNSMRDNYGEFGVDEYYRKVGATYSNPHFPGVKACIFHWLNEWYLHDMGTDTDELRMSGPTILDLACGSGEVTISVLEWWQLGKASGLSGRPETATPIPKVQLRKKGLVPPPLPQTMQPPKILATDPYTATAYQSRTLRTCASLSFRDVAEGELPSLSTALIHRIDIGVEANNPGAEAEDTSNDPTSESSHLEMVICSFALHLVESPSELFALLWELSTKSKWLVVIAPHKKPEIKEGWGWMKWNTVEWRRCDISDHRNDVLHDSASLDKQQTTGHLGKWGEFGDDAGVSKWITAYDATKDCEEFLEAMPPELLRPRRTTSVSDLGDLSKLPPEMISRIFANMTSTTSMVMMATSNSQLFAFAYPFLAQRAREYLSSWAYTRIICIGDNADELPEGCMSTDERLGLQEILGYDEDDELNEGFILYKAAQKYFPRLATKSFVEPWRKTEYYGPHWEDSLRYDSLVGRNLYRFIKTMASKIMINVTKKEYVKETDKVSFKYCLSPLIVWGYDVEEERGPWAGDRLAIVSSEKFEAQVKDEEGEWVDVTAKAEARQAKFREWYN